MYQDSQTFRKTIGDVDVLWHEGLFHLFHLVLPNHDFVAHAVSTDGLNWRRVENALFIGHPGEWDDHMLWTTHVSKDPFNPGQWRMFYTGLHRQDGGMIQRIGLARSSDLYNWTKVQSHWESTPRSIHTCSNISARYDVNSSFPLAASGPEYEATLDEGRKWVSFRDPFYFQEKNYRYLLAAGRIADGPIIRRGCVALFQETQEGVFEKQAPLFWPRLYDDVEVPNLLFLDNRYYLIGSIREDAKIRYWYSDSLKGPYKNHADNVLLPAGNYAGRIGYDDKGPLIWCFYSRYPHDRTLDNLMPPPKRLVVTPQGELQMQRYEGFDALQKSCLDAKALGVPKQLFKNNEASATLDEATGTLELQSDAGFAGFLFEPIFRSYSLNAEIEFRGRGKAGILLRVDPLTSNGYYLSLDLQKGIAQLRAWGQQENPLGQQAFDFQTLQAGYWESNHNGPWRIDVLAYGNYIELSLDDRVLLSLADEHFARGAIGFYVESSCLQVRNYHLCHLTTGSNPNEALVQLNDAG